MKQQQDLLFVEIKEPATVRRDVLLSSKDLLDVLKRYEEYRTAKEEKAVVWTQLKRVMDDLLVLNRKLRNKLPKTKIKFSPVGIAEERAAPADAGWSARMREKEEYSVSGPAPSRARPKSKLDTLQEELAKIEERLSGLE
jgi:hypothetical protein